MNNSPYKMGSLSPEQLIEIADACHSIHIDNVAEAPQRIVVLEPTNSDKRWIFIGELQNKLWKGTPYVDIKGDIDLSGKPVNVPGVVAAEMLNVRQGQLKDNSDMPPVVAVLKKNTDVTIRSFREWQSNSGDIWGEIDK